MRKAALLRLVAAAIGCVGCADTRATHPSSAPADAANPPIAAETSTDPADGAGAFSPQPEANPDPRIAARCALTDAALTRAAHRLALDLLAGKAELESGRVERALRAEGAPYVWPHAWSLVGSELGPLEPKLDGWLASFNDGGERRCGLSITGKPHEQQAAVLIAVDALADLEPLPSHVRPGAWVEVGAHLLGESSAAKVVVLGPRGSPFGIPTSFSGRALHARFMADAPGTWTVQVLATVRGGPRPVLEAELVAGTAAAPSRTSEPTDDNAIANDADPAAGLWQLLDHERRQAGLPPLRRDARLDRLAAQQAQLALSQRRLAHDLGNGDPGERVARAGITASMVGENLAHADNTLHAHRALWSSPSHRGNMLNAHFDSIGIGVARDADSLWVCQLFARLSN